MRIRCETCGNVGTIEGREFIALQEVLCMRSVQCGSGGPEDIYYPHATMLCLSYDLTIIRETGA